MSVNEHDVLKAMTRSWYNNHVARAAALGEDMYQKYDRARREVRPLPHQPEDSIPLRNSRFWGNPFPKIRFLCPKGHRIVTLQADDDKLGLLNVPPRKSGDGRPENGKVPALIDADWSAFRREHKQPCLDVDCGQLTSGIRCHEHAQKAVDLYPPEQVMTRTRMPCPRAGCRYEGVWTLDKLFMLYATAAYLRWQEIRLPS